MSKIIEKKLTKQFKDKEVFSKEELRNFFRELEPDLKEGTLGWRIHDLKNKNIIQSPQIGYYTISEKPIYKPELSSSKLLNIARSISAKFEDVKYCMWETQWINEFSLHQSGKKMIIIEIEKDLVASLFFELKDNFDLDIYLNPDKKTIDFYISESQNPVIIKRMITRSPISKSIKTETKIFTPLIEKLLVDIYTDDQLFYFYQGAELTHIYRNVLKNYTINYTTLFSYASRREKEDEIKNFMLHNLYPLVKDIIQ